MLRPFVNIKIQQATSYSYKNSSGATVLLVRNRLIELDFVEKYEIERSWENHTDWATISFPKNIQLSQSLNNGDELLFSQSATYNAILGGVDNQNGNGENTNIAPLIMKGDLVYIQDGYWSRNENGEDIQRGKTVFAGYVSVVKSDVPIEIECEDNFFLLKRTPFDSTVWNKTSANGSTDLYSLINHILDLVNKQFSENSIYNILSDGKNVYPKLNFTEIPNSITSKFNLGYLEIGDLTCAEVLQKLKDRYHFESTFIDNSLYFGVTIYNDTEQFSTSNPTQSGTFFYFEDVWDNGTLIASANIFDDPDLEYTNKEDVVLSAIVHCKVKNKTGRVTKDGYNVTKLEKIKIMVYWDIVTQEFKYVDLSKPGEVTPNNPDGGERHDFPYPVDINDAAPSISTLFNYGVEHLKKYYYTGFKGKFTTFGFPFIDWNFNVNLISPIFPDRNGQYKVKKVVRRGGQGLEQDIYLDFKNNAVIPINLTSIFMI
jgi:hypothetical protein